MKKYYVNVYDYQGGKWCKGCVGTIEYWKNRAIEWCNMDENFELLDTIKYYYKNKLYTELIDIINNIWSMRIIELDKDNIKDMIFNFDKEDLGRFIEDLIDIIGGNK